MDETRFELPAWLPWATTACLAALVACLGELWIIEKMRFQLARDQGALAEAALKAAENQLEAERIIGQGEREHRRGPGPAASALRVALLLPPDGAARPERPSLGAVAWDPSENRGQVTIARSPEPPAGIGYHLWLEGPEGSDDCGAVAVHSGEDPVGSPIRLTHPIAPGSRFVLLEERNGESRTPDEAKAGGPIVLATLPIDGKISPTDDHQTQGPRIRLRHGPSRRAAPPTWMNG